MSDKENSLSRIGQTDVKPVASRTAPTNESRPQHSPLPWAVSGCRILNATDDVIVGDYGGDDTYCNFETDDMAFIVRSVNSHDDLIEAIQFTLNEDNNWMECREALRKALRKAVA